MKRIILVVVSILYCTYCMAEYVDLGLPSGTKWSKENEIGFYNWVEALAKFDNKLPNNTQFDELKDFCSWIWTGKGFKVVGPNGNFIYLPATGWRNCTNNESLYSVGSCGNYWSSTSSHSIKADNLFFFSEGVALISSERCQGLSVRLVMY